MDYKLLIDGALVDGASTMNVENPATNEVLAVCPRGSRAQLDQAVAAAKAAFVGWSATPIDVRKKALVEIAGIIEANTAELARTLTEEQGKPLREATGEVGGAAAFFRFFASHDLPVRVIEDSPGRRVEAHRKPLGVVAAIVPWNVPFALAAFKLPAALLAGNTIVLKPAATTPLTTLRLGMLIKDVLPRGVLNVITDANDLGDALTSHADVRKISFTGSTVTGSKVMANAAAGLRRVTLELGGNDAAIVLDDVDPKQVAPKLFWAAFRNAGQLCVAIKRLYVHESVYDQVCAELTALADATIVGDGLDPATQIGPVQNKRQFERLKDLLEDSKHRGRVIAGGDVPDKRGYFMRPTIVRDIAEGTRLVDEEQFGPILPIIKYTDPEDALARANASAFGLGGSVWSANVDRATALADRMDAGTVWVNQHMVLAPHIPLAGAKSSGVGVELGAEGLAEFTQLKIVNIAKS